MLENVDLDESKAFSYKGYCGTKSFENGYWYGKILDIKPDLVSYETDEEDRLFPEFCKAVDEYIENLRELRRI